MANTARRILDAAERLAQSRGFNGFSYADISAELGITKASLHHHFSTKADLGRALILRYSERFSAELDAIGQNQCDPLKALTLYAELFRHVLLEDRLCLCGMFAAEYSTLPESMQQEIRRFFDVNEKWLHAVIQRGRREQVFHKRGPVKEAAQTFLSALEGAMLVARTYGDATRFTSTAKRMIDSLKAAGRRGGRA